jgi:geranylgeranyl diphosphate synthase type I
MISSMQTSGFEGSMAHFRRRFDRALEDFVRAKLKGSLVTSGASGRTARAAADIAMAQGKRIRPYLAYRTAKTFGVPFKASLSACIALELFHDFALVHDDIMDRSDERRGRMTVHKRFETEHWKNSGRGSPEQYGTSLAILAGDLLASWSEHAMGEARISGSAARIVIRAWSILKEEVILGQALDVYMACFPGRATKRKIMSVMALKSGRYSIARPILMGYALANKKADENAILRAAEPLGIAFQIQDDIISTFGDPEQTGKSADSDLKEGKLTLIAWETMRRIKTAADKKRWNAAFGNTNASPGDLDRLREMMKDTGALESANVLAKRFVGQSVKLADDLPGIADWFKEFALMLEKRTS